MSPIKTGMVLIVDDIPYWSKLLSTLLSHLETKIAENYNEALLKLREYDFDIVIIDIRLEDEDIWNVDGLALLKEIRNKKPEVRIIIITGYLDSMKEDFLSTYNPEAIFNKGLFNNEIFRREVERLMHNSK